ncbi:MAG: hypothetical protein SVZ03_11590 [Spirochaetota bacterium]|nr:hypothetical protein [Spirochaetota bacterium]
MFQKMKSDFSHRNSKRLAPWLILIKISLLCWGKMLRLYLLYIISIISLYAFAVAYDKETEKIMPFVASRDYCTECHRKGELKNNQYNVIQTCDNLCLKCHKDITSHHEIGLKIEDQLHQKLHLTEKNRIACFTCHNLGIKRFDSSSWKAESLFESMFKRKSRYKTYYLAIKNDKGQLCKKCH